MFDDADDIDETRDTESSSASEEELSSDEGEYIIY